MSFEPTILGILCHWCSYSAADLAGASRMAYPANLKVVRVMCTGRVDPTFVLHALARGADGVLVCGCHPGDCHYVSGNTKALGRMHLLGRLLADFGIEPERVRLEWVSAQESERYANLVAEMTEQVRALGPLRWPDNLAPPESREPEVPDPAPPQPPPVEPQT